MQKVVLATGNSGKVRELASLLNDCGLDVVAQTDLGVDSAEETGLTFIENASIKAPNPAHVTGLPAPLAQKISSYRALVDIERFDIAGSMGPGTEPPEMNMVVEHMSLDAGWVRQNLVYTAIENLKLISGRGDSMAPTIRSGDALIADIGVTSVESDAIYFFLMRGQQHVKRIQRNLDGLTIISDNSQYREINVPADRESDIQVLAQIIYWWTGRSF